METAKIEELRSKFPGAELIELKSKSATVVARVTKAEVDMFRELITGTSTKGRAMERFVRACVVYPSPDEVSTILNLRSALVEKWGEALLDAAGADEEVEAKKL